MSHCICEITKILCLKHQLIASFYGEPHLQLLVEGTLAYKTGKCQPPTALVDT